MVILFLLACGAGAKTASTDSTPTDTDTGTAWVEEPITCETPDVTMTETDAGWDVTTEHYTLEIAGFDEDETRNLGELAETAWTGFAAFFGKEVAGPMDVRIAADADGFAAELAADGITGLDGAGGYYDPNGGRAYLYRQPTAYYSRVLMLHEMVHQYQYQAEHISSEPFWYGEGLAESLGRHHWDGDCLQLRVRPLLSWEDAAASAEAELESDPPDLTSVLGGGEVSRPISQELVRLLASDPNLAPKFTAWRAAVAAGTTSATDVDAFAAAIEPIDALTDDLAAFVPQDQEPLSPVYLDWIPQSDDSAFGFADESSSAARVKGEVSSFQMSTELPTGDASVGTVYGYDPDTGDLELAFLANDGTLSRFAVIGGAVTWDNQGTVSPGSTVSWSQVAGADATTVTVGSDSVDLPRSLPPAGGLALYAAEARFTGISWE